MRGGVRLSTGRPADACGLRRRVERPGHHARRDRGRAARPARRAPRRNRRVCAGACAEHDRVRRSRLERGDRQPPARCGALPRLAPDRALLRTRPHRSRRARHRRLRGRPATGRAHPAARDGGGRDRGPPPRRPLHPRRPARRVRPAHAALVPPRPPRGDGRAARARPGGAGRLRGRARLARRRRARPHALRARLRGGPRLAALHPVARAPGHRLRPPPATPRAAAAADAHRPPPPRLHDLRAAARRLARLPPRLGRAPAERARGRPRRRGPHPPPGRRAAPARRPRAVGARPRRPDARDRRRLAAALSTAGPAACTPFGSDPRGEEREWTLLGASRGEAGILGEGIRQALLRDPTYAPALAAVAGMAP